jgi:hypothetical protein
LSCCNVCQNLHIRRVVQLNYCVLLHNSCEPHIKRYLYWSKYSFVVSKKLKISQWLSRCS